MLRKQPHNQYTNLRELIVIQQVNWVTDLLLGVTIDDLKVAGGLCILGLLHCSLLSDVGAKGMNAACVDSVNE